MNVYFEQTREQGMSQKSVIRDLNEFSPEWSGNIF